MAFTGFGAADAPQRSVLELLLAVDEARQRPIEIDNRVAAGMLRTVAGSDRDVSVYALCRGRGVSWLDAVSTLRVLRDAEFLAASTTPGFGETFSLTEYARRTVGHLIGVMPVAPRYPKPQGGLATAGSGTLLSSTHTVATPSIVASAAASVAGIASVRAMGSTTDHIAHAAVIDSLFDRADQEIGRLAQHTGLALIEASETVRVLRDAGLVLVLASSGPDRISLNLDGRRLGQALRAMAAADRQAAAPATCL